MPTYAPALVVDEALRNIAGWFFIGQQAFKQIEIRLLYTGVLFAGLRWRHAGAVKAQVAREHKAVCIHEAHHAFKLQFN